MGRIQTITNRQRRAVASKLTHGAIAEAAKATGVSHVTIRKIRDKGEAQQEKIAALLTYLNIPLEQEAS